MKSVVKVFVYVILFVSHLINRSLGSGNSLSNVFERKSYKTNIRKIRSNSISGHKWDELEVKQTSKQSLDEVDSAQVVTAISSWSSDHRDRRSPVSHNSLAPIASTNKLRTSAEHLFATNRNSVTNISAKIYIQEKIVDTFKRNNLLTFTQEFSTTSAESSNEQLNGLNIIGIHPGIHWFKDSSKDRILVIGAHYDTVGDTNGVNDNGSGMSVLLETIRLIKDHDCRNNYSIIFVALDLEEYGALGSKYFVNDYLIPDHLIGRRSEFEGAIILDTVLNFNQTLGSQDIPYDIHRALPEWSRQLRKNGFIGDFLAMISRNNIDDKLKNHIRNSWRWLSSETPYKLSELTINSLNSNVPDFTTLSNHANLLRSDHMMFWYHNNSNYKQTLRAVLLTDTGPFRGYMRQCYHTSCDDVKQLSEVNLKFLKLTTEVLTRTALDVTGGQCEPFSDLL